MKDPRRVFLAFCVIVPFLIYCMIYYGHVLKTAPYKFTEFESFQFQFGPGDSLINKYDSKTGDYQYLNSKDSLVKKKVYLTKGDLLYLHHKAAELGLWDFPDKELADKDTTGVSGHKALHYYIAFNYKRKSKKVNYEEGFTGPQKLIDANGAFIKEIQKILDDAEARQKK